MPSLGSKVYITVEDLFLLGSARVPMALTVPKLGIVAV